MKKINVIAVCGSGTVTSSMVANKTKDILEENGFSAEAVETSPNGVENLLSSGKDWDVIVHTSPLIDEYDLPTINAVPLLTGRGEDVFKEELINSVKEL